MKEMLLTANIHAGTGMVRDHLAELIDYYVSLGYDVTVHTSQKPRELIDYIGENGDKYELLVSTGGDGTLNETLNGLMKCDTPPVLCYLPAGTVNDFATSLKIPKEMEEAAKLVENGVPFCCDIGQFGEQYFSYVAAFGAFTEVAYQTPQAIKQIFGRLAYIVEGIKRLPNLRAYRMEIQGDDFELEEDFLFGMVTNSTSVGGFHFEDKIGIAMDDGYLEVVLVRMPRSMNERQAIINGIMKQESVPGLLEWYRTKTLKIHSNERMPWTLDGEFGGEVEEVTISNCHQALKILVPREDLQKEER
ncbi:MAG: diacylglycerol/lipid kinase family protein [Candidatus Merdivicinus sp.]|jgi:diacylglycerol kinase (ATP)